MAKKTSQLKSGALCQLIQKKKEEDIQMDQFHLYEAYLPPTLEAPDSVNEWTDENGELHHIYSRAFEVDGTSFYYLVARNPEGGEVALGFPTVDGDLYREFTQGARLLGAMKN